MNQQLQTILDIILQNKNLTDDEKTILRKAVKKADSDLTISEFKLERTEKVKRTTSILLEETIEELEQKRKAVEAQNRELEIETSLEKVRARTMAMQHSNELAETASLLFQQVSKLGVELWGCSFNIWAPGDTSFTSWWGGRDLEIKSSWYIPLTEDPIFILFDASRRRGDKLWIEEAGGKKLAARYKYMLGLPDVGPHLKGLLKAGIIFPTFQIDHIVNFKHGNVLFITYEPCPEAYDIFKRFTKVFEQTYTRFLDLQKAEAQTREAQIENALERVRSRSMAMHNSEELLEVITVVSEQLEKLGFKFNHVSFANNDLGEDYNFWVSSNGVTKTIRVNVPYANITLINNLRKAQKKSVSFYTDVLTNQENRQWHKHLLKHCDINVFTKDENEYIMNRGMARSIAINHNIMLILGNYASIPYSAAENEIIARFGQVFEQSYTRFLDLQKAEAQTREAQIENALEKVRSRTMAMQHSDELPEAANNLFLQVQGLGIPAWSAGYCIWEDNKKKSTWCNMSSEGEIQKGFSLPSIGEGYNFQKPLINGEPFYVAELSGKKLVKHYDFMKTLPGIREVLEEFDKKGIELPTFQIFHIVYFSHGYLMFITYESVSNDWEIFKRFGKVFQQTYTRFLDLQKAEAQTKEAKIETSLEKVRTVAITLKKSDDMLDIAKVLYEQLLVLGFNNMRNAIIDIHNDDETFLDYDYSHDMSSAVTLFSFYGDPVIEQQIKKIESSNDAFFEIDIKGKELERLIETRLRNGEKDDLRLHKIDHLTYNLYSFGNGAIGISNFGTLSDDKKKVLKRFRNVFTFAYKRYTDLAKAEAQAQEAKIEAALEKVRSVALGLNKSEDMLKVAQALYEQLLNLGFKNIRNSIIDIDNEDDTTFLDYDYSHEMGGTVTLMSYKDDPTLKEQLEDIIATTDGFSEMNLEGKQLQDLIEMRRKNGEADDPRLINTDSLSYILYAFGKGAIGISNFGVLNENQKTILSRFRNVFTFAYQRYADLAQSEAQAAALLAEKQRLEITLSDLQATQKQLIQSEKMASLGELTAGIAHEIQNPLNFVNNFSEVSQELIDELLEELELGNMKDVKDILNDVIQNLEKINHHGKRADGIVKGMLQHSRKSTVEKEPTDINKLADEYLRLAYHGLRAKDKTFNAKMETDFDESIGPVNLIPQDMGRVILNLITNAFYATNEKSSSTQASNDKKYEPTVSVSTKKIKNQVIVSVKDNGNGIPKHVLDKIFQPFFTTKPTGQGTGLGLSMSYDIVKAHNGELKVETKEGKGSTFIINLKL